LADHRFCDECGVALDLHPWPAEPDPAERGCHAAQMRATQIAQFWGCG
jgi:hypothetical protein